jgi:ABC-2 type transport system permease protein
MPETDEAMNAALQDFYKIQPQLRPKDTVRSPWFNFQGYSAFLANSDRQSTQLVEEFYSVVRRRNQIVNGLSWLSPAVNTQNLFNRLAGTGLEEEFSFKTSVRHFHRQIYWFSNGPLFAGREMNANDYRAQPELHPAALILPYGELFMGILFLLAAAALLSTLGSRQFNEHRLRL